MFDSCRGHLNDDDIPAPDHVGKRGSFCRRDVEAEHHSALVMLGDMAMRHPDPRVRYVEQDVDRLTSPHEHRVLPYQVLLFGAVARKNDKAAGAVDMEGMV